MAVQVPVCDFGWNAPDFTLRATDGRTYSSLVYTGAGSGMCITNGNVQALHR
jgi:hypothetical protein